MKQDKILGENIVKYNERFHKFLETESGKATLKSFLEGSIPDLDKMFESVALRIMLEDKGCSENSSKTMEYWNCYETVVDGFCEECKKQTGFDPNDMTGLFVGCTDCTELDFSALNTKNIK